MAEKEIKSSCPAFGTGWDKEAEDCIACSESYSEEYEACEITTSQQVAEAASTDEEADGVLEEQGAGEGVDEALAEPEEELEETEVAEKENVDEIRIEPTEAEQKPESVEKPVNTTKRSSTWRYVPDCCSFGMGWEINDVECLLCKEECLRQYWECRVLVGRSGTSITFQKDEKPKEKAITTTKKKKQPKKETLAKPHEKIGIRNLCRKLMKQGLAKEEVLSALEDEYLRLGKKQDYAKRRSYGTYWSVTREIEQAIGEQKD